MPVLVRIREFCRPCWFPLISCKLSAWLPSFSPFISSCNGSHAELRCVPSSWSINCSISTISSTSLVTCFIKHLCISELCLMLICPTVGSNSWLIHLAKPNMSSMLIHSNGDQVASLPHIASVADCSINRFRCSFQSFLMMTALLISGWKLELKISYCFF